MNPLLILEPTLINTFFLGYQALSISLGHYPIVAFRLFVKQNISGFIRKYNPAYSAMKICGVKIYTSLIYNDEILNSTKYSLHFLGHSKLCKAPVRSNSPNLSLNERG